MFITTDMTSTQVSVQFSRSVMSDSLRPHESQHTRAPCPSPTPGVHSDSCPSSQWCHPAISSSVVPFSSCPRSLPATESFPMSQLFAWGGQSTGVSALSSLVHPIWSFSLDLSSTTTFNQKKIQFPWISERRSNREDFHKTTGTCLPGTKHSKANSVLWFSVTENYSLNIWRQYNHYLFNYTKKSKLLIAGDVFI